MATLIDAIIRGDSSQLPVEFINHCEKADEESLVYRVVLVFIAILGGGVPFLCIASIVKKLTRNLDGKEIIETACKSKAIRDLYERATATPSYDSESATCSKLGPWKIQFDENNFPFGGVTSFHTRTIILRRDRSDEEKLVTFVFELTNAIHAKEFFALWQKLHEGQIDREDYVKEAERIEHQGTLLHHKVMREAIDEMNWSEALDIYKYFTPDFEAEWMRIKNGSHASYYRYYWERYTEEYVKMKVSSCINYKITINRTP